MSNYPITPPLATWKLEALTVFVVCSYYISSVNPAVWKNFDDTDLYNGLGLFLHEPAYQIIDFIGNNYPTLTIFDGLCQVKYFESSDFNWQTGSVFDYQSFTEFTLHCTNDWQVEIAHFLEQIGYCNATDAQSYANMWYIHCINQFAEFQNMNPYDYKRKKWVAGNRVLSEAEITNNINILFAYSQGVVYQPSKIWLYFKHYHWRDYV